MTKIVRDPLDSLKKVPVSKIVEKRYGIEVRNLERELQNAETILSKRTEELASLKAEVVKSIHGESNFDANLLNELIESASAERDTRASSVERLKKELAASKSLIAPLKDQSEVFNNTDALLKASTDKARDFEKVYICYPECSLVFSLEFPMIVKQIELNGRQVHIIWNPKFRNVIKQRIKARADEYARDEGNVR